MAVVNILGVEVDQVTFTGAIEQISSFIDHGQPHQIVTVNPEFIMRAQHDRAFRPLLLFHHAPLRVVCECDIARQPRRV